MPSDSFMTTIEAFSPLESYNATETVETGDIIQPQQRFCPISCRCSLPSHVSLEEHLLTVHHAAHVRLDLDGNGEGQIELQAPVSVSRDDPRRSVLLAQCGEDFLVWILESKRRGDGNVQVSASVQMLGRDTTKTGNDLMEEERRCWWYRGGQEENKQQQQNSFFQVRMFVEPINNGEEERKYSGIIVNNNNNNSEIFESLVMEEEIHARNSTTKPTYQDNLVWLGRALVVMYPTHAGAFRRLNTASGCDDREVSIITRLCKREQ